MPENRNSESRREQENDNTSFMTQKIVGRRDRGRRAVFLVLRSLAAGVFFALGLGAVSWFLLPGVMKHCIPSQGEKENVRIERDEKAEAESTAAAEAPLDTDDTEAAAPLETQEAAMTENEIETMIGSYPYEINDLLRMYRPLQRAAEQADHSVAVISYQPDPETPGIMNKGICTGIAVGKTENEIFLLAPSSVIAEGEQISAFFQENGRFDGEVIKTDAYAGIAVISLPVMDENRSAAERIAITELGNSYLLKHGDIVIAAGAPLGVMHSFDYGFVASVNRQVIVADGEAEAFYLKGAADAKTGTWYLNTNGQLVGWAGSMFADKGFCHTAAAGVSDFKPLLERMMNREETSLLGLQAVTVSAELHAAGMPVGLYITDVLRNKPAYLAGIQPGDILTRYNEEEINSIHEYTQCLEKTAPGETVSITVLRKGIDDYTELNFEAVTSAR